MCKKDSMPPACPTACPPRIGVSRLPRQGPRKTKMPPACARAGKGRRSHAGRFREPRIRVMAPFLENRGCKGLPSMTKLLEVSDKLKFIGPLCGRHARPTGQGCGIPQLDKDLLLLTVSRLHLDYTKRGKTCRFVLAGTCPDK
jgi:hypothetical protein